MQPGRKTNNEAGLTLVELLVVLALAGLLMGAAALYLKPMESPLQSGADMLESLFRQSRARAMATTSAHRVVPMTTGFLAVESAASCSSATWTPEPRFDLFLPTDVTLTSTEWSVCFTSRGTATSNSVVALSHPDYGTRHVEVLLGGAVRSLP